MMYPSLFAHVRVVVSNLWHVVIVSSPTSRIYVSSSLPNPSLICVSSNLSRFSPNVFARLKVFVYVDISLVNSVSGGSCCPV